MQLELAFQPARGPVLLVASSPEAAWHGGIGDWLQAVAAHAWQDERPALVIVPTRGQAQALKARLLGAGQSALGVQFITPPYLRALLQDTAGQPPLREHLLFLLALAAEEQLDDPKIPEAERLAAISIRRTPDHLLRLLDQLDAAGWAFDQIDLPAFRPIVRRFRAHLASCNFETFAASDRDAFARMQKSVPRFSNLLITDFHGAHWPLWRLLRAAVSAAEEATIFLQYPRMEAADLDSAWIGSWEEAFGEAKPARSDDHLPEAAPAIAFLAGIDTREQGDAIIAMAYQFLADERCSRLGIVFPSAGALSRLVASALTREGIAHYDAMGQMAPGIFEPPDFWSWMELQRTPRLNVLLRFLNSLPNDHSFFDKISRRRIADALQRALDEIALDDLPGTESLPCESAILAVN